MLNNLLLGQTAEEKLYVEDVFSTYLYTGTGAAQTITNGIDLAGKGGLVWEKPRESANNHWLIDSERGTSKYLTTVSTGAQGGTSTALLNFNSNGYRTTSGWSWGTSNNMASWTFRKAPKFFDVVTWSGNGVAGRTISHSLGVAPGMIIVKETSVAGQNWIVWHRTFASNNNYLMLNRTDAVGTFNVWNNTAPTSTSFTVSSDTSVNASGSSYVAYLFAHDTSADGIVQCGSFTTDGSGNATVNLGWEPQYVLVKASSTTDDWRVYDVMRGMTVGDNDPLLRPNLSNAELTQSYGLVNPVSTGFNWSFAVPNTTYIYLAIRRGPMRTPTDATKVFSPQPVTAELTAINSGFPVDLSILSSRATSDYRLFTSRLVGGSAKMNSNSTAAEYTDPNGYVSTKFDFSTSLQYDDGTSGNVSFLAPMISFLFRRAPGFFDVVCYTGTGSARTVSHNLGVAPELMIVKRRNDINNWVVYDAFSGNTKIMRLNSTMAASNGDGEWNSTTPTSSAFSLGTLPSVNGSGGTYVAYLFASCPGVSKVGTYTGNGTGPNAGTQNIDCGFTNGARFVLIKRTDSTGSWLVSDTARGIVSGNDPSLALNSTAAEVTSLDWLDPYSAGFTVNQESTNNANVNGATYLYLSIA